IHLRAHVTAAEVDLGLLRLYLPGDAAVLPERGILSAGATVVHDATEGTRISAGARVRDVVLHRRGQDGAFATSPQVTVTPKDLLVKDRNASIGRAEIEGDVTVTEALYEPSIRYAFTDTRLVTEDLTWPSRRPGRVEFTGTLPGGGRLDVRGALTSQPMTTDLNVRATRLPVDLANRYARLAGTLAGVADADARIVASVDGKTTRLRVTGAAGATRLVVADPGRSDQPPLGVDRLDVSGFDYEWPSRLTVGFVNLRKPWASVDRDASGAVGLRNLFVRQPMPGEPSAAGSASPPAVDVTIGELRVQDGHLTLLDAVASPATRLEVSAIGLTIKNAGWPAHGPAQIALDATLPGGGTLTVAGSGELDQRVVRVNVTARTVDIAQAQPWRP